MLGKFRPQVFLAILCGTVFGIVGMYIGLKMNATEVVTAIVGSVFGFLGGVSLKVLEQEGGEEE
tara:strand:- start:272 stop:463 length:192 start_codon:yes stop_codon:yes gene_type:complete